MPRHNLADQVTAKLRRAIVSGEIKPGTPLAEPALAKRFAASRAPVREALIALERDGLVEFNDRSRTRVRPLAEADVQEICSMRVALESLAARLVTPRWTGAETQMIEANLRAQEKAATLGELSRLDVEMHESIVRLSGHRRLIEAWGGIRWQFEMCLAHTHRLQQKLAFEPRRITVDSHRRLLAALASRKPERAATTMAAHIETSLEWSVAEFPSPASPVKSRNGKLASKALKLALAVLAAALTAQADDIDFFEAKVRPLLVERCYECHSHEKKIKGGLTLDSRSGWEKGGDSGPALMPGKPDESLLIKAIRYTDPDLSMPPKRKLSAAEVAVLTEWVRIGAPDPRAGGGAVGKLTAMTLEEARGYWAYQPLRQAQPPGDRQNPIDSYVLARLDREGLKPSPPADPRALVRRLYFDLLGLPPTFAEMEAFAAKPNGPAWARLVDDLLARPEYGQRWGRHWLDLARYSDTTEKSTDAERRIPFAYTYRDYVIDAFNADKPFDRFVVEQIAADRLPAEDHADLRALGFLTVGRRFEGNIEAPQLIIDDQIDVIGRGLLGLTLACARCHDHKFDAIPTADYYSLYGILASSSEPLDLPEVGVPVSSTAVTKYREQRAAIFAEYEKHLDACVEKARRLLRELAPEYLGYLVAASPQHRTVEGFIPLDTPRGLLVRGGPPRWEALIAESLRRGDKFFTLWKRLLETPRDGFPEKAQEILEVAEPAECDPTVLAALQVQPPASMLEVADVYGRLLAQAPEIAELIDDPNSPLQFTREEIRADVLRFVTEHQLVSRPDGEQAGKIRGKLTVLETQAPIERARVILPSPTPLTAHVMLRGDRLRPGAETPRRFLQALATVDGRCYEDDGRLELARAIANPANPLTARVIVNRVWQQHFGHGLVATPDNFGAMGEKPSHPELLDHLAGWFMEHGWSLKALHRYILTSATWQQSGVAQPLAMEKDPGNRLLWRMPPRRLEFEPLRDSLLRAAGRLDTRCGGRSAPLDDKNVRRAIYGFTDRFRIPSLLRNFDVANPDTSISRRAETIHPLQALYLLNSTFVRAQAEAVARLPEVTGADGLRERIGAVYRRVLVREPDAEETALAWAYLDTEPDERPLANFVQALMLSNEFTFSD